MNKNNVFEYYNNQGWKEGSVKNMNLDEEINVNHNKSSQKYNSKTRKRVLRELNKLKGKKNKLLDVASGPLHIKEFLEYSKSFSERHCVDFSKLALKKAKHNLTKFGQKKSFFYNVNFLNSDFKDNFFDAAISLSTLYHVNIDEQKKFVNKLIDCVRPGGLVIITYSNPFSLESIFTLPKIILSQFKSLVRDILINLKIYKYKKNELYFKRHNIFFWNFFKKSAEVKIIADRTFTASFEKKIIPNNKIGKKIFKFLFFLENASFYKYLSTYYIVILKKKIYEQKRYI